MKEYRKRHIIFDLDGTLSDTAKASTAAMNEVRVLYDLPEVSEIEIRSVMGFADPEFYYRLYPGYPQKTLNEVRCKVNCLEDNIIESLGKSILFPGIEDLLNDLSKKGYMLHIASTGSTAHVHTTLNSSAINHLFEGVHCNELEKVKMVKGITAGHNKEECLMVGDMSKDSDAARANNILALGAAFGYLTLEDYHLFDSILHTPTDIYKYL